MKQTNIDPHKIYLIDPDKHELIDTGLRQPSPDEIAEAQKREYERLRKESLRIIEIEPKDTDDDTFSGLGPAYLGTPEMTREEFDELIKAKQS